MFSHTNYRMHLSLLGIVWFSYCYILLHRHIELHISLGFSHDTYGQVQFISELIFIIDKYLLDKRHLPLHLKIIVNQVKLHFPIDTVYSI